MRQLFKKGRNEEVTGKLSKSSHCFKGDRIVPAIKRGWGNRFIKNKSINLLEKRKIYKFQDKVIKNVIKIMVYVFYRGRPISP
ncbi:hypothetical protein [Bacillus xiapuensis]|uniref:hypothetical protein n=1 Tax=Bacillus xiapuensis TaxID=2014075 RepID=UPI001E56A27C|nr:hypothetical protein [Bacillus xiapuensis]